MPRNTRNWWIELHVDGRRHPIATGPSSRDGGFVLNIKTRVHRNIQEILSIVGSACPSGSGDLKLSILHTDPHTGVETVGSTYYTR